MPSDTFAVPFLEQLAVMEQTWHGLRELCLLTQTEELQLRGTVAHFDESVRALQQLVASATNERDTLKHDNAVLARQLAASQRQATTLQGYNSALQGRVNELYGHNTALTLRVDELQRDVQRWKQRVAQLEQGHAGSA